MKFQIPTVAAALGFVLLASSCYPYQEGPPRRRGPNNQQQQQQPPPLTPAEQQKQKEQRERAKAEQELKRKQQEDDRTTSGGNTTDPGPTTGGTTPPPSPPKRDIPVATKAPGREGYVLSPFNSRLIDVRGIPSGTLVADPTFPESDKKHFRVP